MALISNLLLRARAPKTDYLRIGLLISLGVHASVLAIRLHHPVAPLDSTRPLEVALVNMQTPVAPQDAQILAQADLSGGGADARGLSTTPLPRTTTHLTDEAVLADLRKRQEQLEQEQQRLFSQITSQRHVATSRTDRETLENAPEPGDDTRDQESLVLSAQIAALKERIERYNAQPRKQFTGPSARSDDYAHYLETWRTKIEQLGTDHYPDQARGRVYGSLQLTVYIRQNGTLERIQIDHPSEHAILNLAAQRIVQLAAPFAPLPPAIAKDADVLAITRTWHFQNQQLHTQIP